MKLKKGDMVQVMRGIYKGKQGKILQVIPDKSKCVVEGVNFKVKHQRPLSPDKPGGRLKKEAPLHISNVKLICPRCGELTKVGKKKIGGKNVRICKKCNEAIDE
jgi:large subunit ribosomal protein L24